MTITIRPARADDGVALQRIERLAGERFREVGMSAVADDEPDSLENLAAYAAAHRSWVATTDITDADGTDGAGADGAARAIVGYVLVDVVDGCAHVEQITVRPDHQGAGVGRALLDQVEDWAVETGRPAITLTTFSDVPWNRPLYEHVGFRVLAEHEIGPELRSLRASEAAHGLDPRIRVCMRRDVAAPSRGQNGSMDDVLLRPIQEPDLDLLCRSYTDPDAYGEFEWIGFRDPKALRQRWEEDGWLGVEHARLAVVSAGAFAGDVAYKDRSQGVAKGAIYEIGIGLLPEHRGHGVGTAAQRLLVAYLFDHTPAHRLLAYTEVENLPEQGALEKVGFEREGVIRKGHFRAGKWRDSVLYALLRD